MLFDRDALAARSAALESATAEEILRFALAEYSPNIAISTAFGVEGCALIHMALQIDPKVKVFTIDTGYLFDETQQLMRRFVDRYGIAITTFEPELTVADSERRYLKLYESDPDRCCAMRKVEPNQRALRGLHCWIAGLRRDQGESRRHVPILERRERDGDPPLVKVLPLASWTRKDTWKYVLDHEVPYNALLDQGYTSIGCVPCTRAVAPGEDERAGRWNGKKSECGIHS